MKALIIIIVIGLLILAAAILADTALAQTVTDEAGSEQLAITDLSLCWRQLLKTWPPGQVVTEFSEFHQYKNGKAAPSCGGVFYTTEGKFRWFPSLGTKCWYDGCIQNQIVNDTPNGRPKVKTTMWSLPDAEGNLRPFTRVAIWNERK